MNISIRSIFLGSQRKKEPVLLAVAPPRSGYGRRDHGGESCLVLSVFETPDDEDAFMDASSYVDHASFASSNLETISQRSILADTWLLPTPEPRGKADHSRAGQLAIRAVNPCPGHPVGGR